MSEGYRPQATVVTKTLIATFAAGLIIGILIGWGAANSRSAPIENLAANGGQSAPEQRPIPAETAGPDGAPADDAGKQGAVSSPTGPAASAGPPAPNLPTTPFEPDVDGLWPAEHLIVGIDGLKADVLTLEWLNTFKPGGVVLRPENVSDSLQVAALVLQIKQAIGLGTTLADPPLILYQDNTRGFPTLLADTSEAVLAADASAAQIDAAVSRAVDARKQGIAAVVGPALDVPPDSTDTVAGIEAVTAALTRAEQQYTDGLGNAGVIAIAGTFPGEAIAEGTGRNRHIPADQMDRLAAVMQPFKLAMDAGVPGVLIGHVAVPGIDVDQPVRPASLSPKLLRTLIRDQWRYDGVLIASDVTGHSMTRDLPRDEIVLKALVSGCDAVILGHANREEMRTICDAFVRVSKLSDFPMERIQASKQRLQAWRDRLSQPALAKPAVTVAKSAPEPAKPMATETPEQSASENALEIEEPAETPAAPENAEPAKDAQDDVQPEEPAGAGGTETPDADSKATDPKTADGEKSEPKEPADAIADSTDPSDESESKADTSPELEEVEKPAVAAADATEPESEVPPNSILVEHKITQGDSLTLIAKRYGVALSDLRKWNKLEDDTIKIGFTLKVYQPAAEEGAGLDLETVNATDAEPATSDEAESSPKENETVANTTDTVAPAPSEPKEAAPAPDPQLSTSEPEEKPAPAPAPPPEGTKKQEHRVAAGETVETIADTYGVTMAEILAWNGLAPDQLPLTPDTVVTIHLPVATAEVKAAPAAKPEPKPGSYEIYEVSAGDNLRRIAIRFGTTQKAIIDLNGIERADHVEIGWKLKIPKGNTAGTRVTPASEDTGTDDAAPTDDSATPPKPEGNE